MPEAEAPRECGSCRLCCKLLSIGEEQGGKYREDKPAGVWCKHAGPDGCRIYDSERPSDCTEFECAWLQGALKPADRPDRTKILASFEKWEGSDGLGLACYSEYKRAFATARHRRVRYAALKRGMRVSEKVTGGAGQTFLLAKNVARRAPEKGEGNAE